MKEIQLTRGYVTQVDDEDFEFLMQWKWQVAIRVGRPHLASYATRTDHKKMIRMHRVIMNCSKNTIVDHIDGNGLNNQKSNLRICTHAENSVNRKSGINSSSKYLGVSIHRSKGHVYWKAQLIKNKVSVLRKSFKTQEAAALAYNEAAMRVYGQFARLNVVD